MSTIPVVAAENKAKAGQKVSECSHRAKAAYVPRPSFNGDKEQGKGWERSIIAKAHRLPHGLTIASNEGIWYAVVKSSLVLHRRQDCSRNMLAVIKSLINLHRRKSKTIAATWADIASMAKVSTSTVKRTLAKLRAHGLLATIASGKSARKGENQNWAPVYLLTLPEDKKLSEENDRPSHLKESNTSLNAHAREKLSYDQRNRRAFLKAYRDSNGDFGKKNQAPSKSHILGRKTAYERAIRCLQNHALALRGLTVKAILQETKGAFQADWTVADVLKALEERPTGEVWQTSGAGGMKSIQAWLRLRLAVWKDSKGNYVPSHSQKRAREHQEQQKQRQQQKKAELSRESKTVSAPSWFAEYKNLLRLGKGDAARKLLKENAKS